MSFEVGDRVGVRWAMYTNPPRWRLGKVVAVSPDYRVEFDAMPGFNYVIDVEDMLTEEEMLAEQIGCALGGPGARPSTKVRPDSPTWNGNKRKKEKLSVQLARRKK